jgi:hypothetical protein
VSFTATLNGKDDINAGFIGTVLWQDIHRDDREFGQAVVVGQESINAMLHRRGQMQ